MTKATTQKDGILACLNVVKDKEVDSETLTVLCFKAFPTLYSMDLFREYPRMDKVTRIIREHVENGLIKEENGKYQITSEGLAWGSKNSNLVRFAASKISTEEKAIFAYNIGNEELLRETNKLRKTTAYEKFKMNKNGITVVDFMDFLRLDIYTTKQLFDRKVLRVKVICDRDNELKELFSFMSGKFGVDYVSFKHEIDKLMVEK